MLCPERGEGAAPPTPWSNRGCSHLLVRGPAPPPPPAPPAPCRGLPGGVAPAPEQGAAAGGVPAPLAGRGGAGTARAPPRRLAALPLSEAVRRLQERSPERGRVLIFYRCVSFPSERTAPGHGLRQGRGSESAANIPRSKKESGSRCGKKKKKKGGKKKINHSVASARLLSNFASWLWVASKVTGHSQIEKSSDDE